jgi:hypothetical protein
MTDAAAPPNVNSKTGAWGWPELARKAHYFTEAQSLCGRWAYTGTPTGWQGGAWPDGCVECCRRLGKRRVRKA